MNRNRIIAALFVTMLLFSAVSAFAADNIQGVWKIIDDKTGKPNAYVALYMNNGKLYGRMLATISLKTGVIDDTINIKKFKASVYVGEPSNCGLDFVYDCVDKGKSWKGSITDPNDGKAYDCTITKKGNQLTVRGSLKGTGGLLGRNQTWMEASASDIPDFTMPNTSSWKPVIPKKK